jgi:4-amino-4-deoxy-L-arabinose transferase-like glycosyltransferase
MKKAFIILSALFLIVGFVRVLDIARKKSATYDEAFYLTYGYSLLKTGDFRMAIDKPPLAPLFSAAPLLALRPAMNFGDVDWLALNGWKKSADPWKYSPFRWNFSLKFLFANTVGADRMLFASRLSFAALFFAAGVLIFFLVKGLYGQWTAAFMTFIYSFSPELLANASLATEDFTAAALFFLSIISFVRLSEKPSAGAKILFGALLGLCLVSKYTALLVLPALVVVYFAIGGLKPKDFLIPAAVCAAVVLAFYGFIGIPYYFKGLANTLAYQRRGQAGYCWGNYSSSGFWYYYLVVLLFKTPLPVLLSLFFFFSRKVETRVKIICAVPVMLIIAVSSFNKIQLGLRYILPAYPFLFLIASRGFSEYARKLKPSALVPVALCVWLAFSSLKIHPHCIAYFNELAGGPANGPEFLVDSNIDWGQDLSTLREYVRKNRVSDVVLSYYGACLPGYAGFDFQDLLSFGIWGEKNHVNSDKPVKEILAVSVTNLKGVYFGRIGSGFFNWLESRRPEAQLGYSIYVYDITDDADAHEQLARSYLLLGDTAKTRREFMGSGLEISVFK